MNEVSDKNFGVIIAFLLPGFIFLWGASYSVDEIRTWLGTSNTDAPTVGGFLYISLASLAIGLVISALRWIVLDNFCHLTGIKCPDRNFANLKDRLAAYQSAADNHYRFYCPASDGTGISG